jgi:hypothetical protein
MPRIFRLSFALAAFCALVLQVAQVRGDAVPPPPSCPKGHSPRTGHGGTYCLPPPPKCRAGETARESGSEWYCEPPPPAGGCPAGSAWRSTSAEEAWCDGQRCESDKDAGCRKTALCVKEVTRHRHPRSGGGAYIEEHVLKTCSVGKASSACPDGSKCVTALRWAPEAAKTK